MKRAELIEQIHKKKSFLCVGLDTDIAKIPSFLLDFEDPIFEFNKRIIDATAERCNLSEDQVLINIDKYGNTTGGTIPIALDEAVETGRLKNNDLLLLAAFGGGFTWGSVLIRWTASS